MTLAARGLSNRRIAHDLRVAEANVKRHLLADLYPKPGVGSRTEATRKALIEGWLTIQDLAQETRLPSRRVFFGSSRTSYRCEQPQQGEQRQYA